MEILRDLNELAKEVVKNFNENFEAKDCRIPQAFKDNVRTLKSFSIVYNDYSVIIKGDGVRSKDSYVPNQSFYMASYFIEYSYELSRYKQKIMPWLSDAGITTNELTAFFTHERDNGKKDIENGDDKFIKILNSIGYNESDRNYLIKFVTDYNWWYGSKTIDRSDFFNSPVLSIMGLSASSNAAMALIVDLLTQNPEFNNLLLTQIENTKDTNMSNISLQQIFYGAPGTGKSHFVKCDEKVKRADEKNLVFRTTFHPDSDYSTFVGAYKPTMKTVADKYKAVVGKDEEITYEFIPQVFLQAYVAAWNNQAENVFLVIEEINRGNCAQIFGDLFQLLDRDDDGFSEYPIKADRDLTKFLSGKDENGNDVLVNKDGIKEGKLKLPNNLFIWATMNTSDQSLFPIDSAFKRRWDWKYIKIKKGIDKETKKELDWKIKVGEDRFDWWEFLKAINYKIDKMTSSADKQLGYFFCLADGKGEISADTFVNKVAFYLWNDVFKDYAEDGSPLLKYKKKEEDKSESDLTFPDFFDERGEIDSNVVKQFVEKVMKEDEMDKPAE